MGKEEEGEKTGTLYKSIKFDNKMISDRLWSTRDVRDEGEKQINKIKELEVKVNNVSNAWEKNKVLAEKMMEKNRLKVEEEIDYIKTVTGTIQSGAEEWKNKQITIIDTSMEM